VRAGIADTPLPAGAIYLYSVPGVTNVSGGLATIFTCTSVSTSAQTVTVEVFDQTGTASGSGNKIVNAGDSVRFGTQNSAVFFVDVLLGSGLVKSGAARILSTDKKLMCTADMIDSSGSTTFTMHLEMIAKLKQKAAN
jgi:hypothetical protein